MGAIEINGSFGEGGGQIIRTSLAMSAIAGMPVEISNIRASRPKPGLRPQHLAAVNTLAEICKADLQNASIGSSSISFKAKKVLPSNITVNIGTAGSISLLLSQVLPVSLLEETKLLAFGGTNVSFSPPIEFLQECLFPALRKMGARFNVIVNRRGYFPKGLGSVSFSSKPARLPLKPISLTDFGKLEFVRIYSHCTSLPKSVAKNQVSSAKYELESLNTEFEEVIECRERSETIGSGITLFARTTSGAVLSGSALGAKALPAEKVGKQAAQNLLAELNAKRACDSHLADQLIPFMALAKGSSELNTTKLTQHCLTNIAVVEKFLPVKFKVQGEKGKPATISVKGIGFKKKEAQ